jgi:hypothetical protein
VKPGQQSAAGSASPRPAIPSAIEADIHRLANALEASNSRRRTAAEKQEAIQNLQAQENMAAYAGRMFWVGFAESTITFIGVVLVGFTLAATRSAANEARRAADAAMKALDQSEVYARQELRAYLGIEKLEFTCTNFSHYTREHYVPKDSSVAGASCDDFLCVTVKNFGQTPAFDIMVFANWITFPPNTRPPLGYFGTTHDSDFLETGPVSVSISKFMLQRDQTHASRIAIWDLRPVLDALERRGELYIYGRIYYRDAFNRPWRTKFSFSWNPASANTPFEFVPYREYNTEDQQPAPK